MSIVYASAAVNVKNAPVVFVMFLSAERILNEIQPISSEITLAVIDYMKNVA